MKYIKGKLILKIKNMDLAQVFLTMEQNLLDFGTKIILMDGEK